MRMTGSEKPKRHGFAAKLPPVEIAAREPIPKKGHLPGLPQATCPDQDAHPADDGQDHHHRLDEVPAGYGVVTCRRGCQPQAA